jgi:predicted RNase H-like HicB family nuclease
MASMERKLNYVVFPEDGVFVARCLDVEVASDGPTEQEAVANLKEALDLYFEDHENTLAAAGGRVVIVPAGRDPLPHGTFARF